MMTKRDLLQRWVPGLCAGLLGLTVATAAGLATSREAVPVSIEARQYAPDRLVDIEHLRLEVIPDFQARTVSGNATFRFRPIGLPLRALRLDAVDLTIAGVTATAPIRAWHVETGALNIHFDPPVAPDVEVTLGIDYSAEPQQGLYFRTPELGYRVEDTHLFTQGQAILARHWYPCFDAPNEMFTSEVICRVPADMTVLSNGRLVDREVDEEAGLQTVRWLQDKPHVNYLIALAAGYFVGIEDRWRDIPLTFHVPASQAHLAHNSFRDTRDMMAFFEREIGVLYPWDRYAQVCVQDFVAGGMENTTLTILTDRTLFPDEVGNLRSSQGLVAHELVHQWFGNLVTCKDWSHLWLNEGFATYYENLYDRHRNGHDSFLYQMLHDAERVLSHTDDQTPVVHRSFASPDEQFSFRAYPKGGWVVHMLRSQLGEELFRRCVRTYLERHAHQVVTTENLGTVFEELSGRSWDAFFDQWLYHAGTPVLEIDYRWEEADRLARLSIRQTQKLTERVPLFQFPLILRFKGEGFIEDREVWIRHAAQDFAFPLPQAPRIVRVDPECTVLARVNFTPPLALLRAQLEDPGDMLGRLFAVRALAARRDAATVAAMRRTLVSDPFYGVRIEASRALRGMHTPAARQALLEGLDQPDDRVQQQVLRDLRGFHTATVFRTLEQTLDTTANPDLLREAILGLGGNPDPAVPDRLTALLEVPSFDGILALAAIQAMRAHDNPGFIAPLSAWLQNQRPNVRPGDYGAALRTLAFLARHAEDRTSVRELLTAAVEDPDDRVRRGAINALGELGDLRAIPLLESFAGARAKADLAEAARSAIAALRAQRPAPAELGNLRREVLELQQSNRELRQEIDSLKQRLDSLPRPPAGRR